MYTKLKSNNVYSHAVDQWMSLIDPGTKFKNIFFCQLLIRMNILSANTLKKTHVDLREIQVKNLTFPNRPFRQKIIKNNVIGTSYTLHYNCIPLLFKIRLSINH